MPHQTRVGFPPPSPPIGGYTDPAYAAARDVFTRLIADGPETGAAAAVVHNGRRVVDLHGGWQDDTAPWAPETLALAGAATEQRIAEYLQQLGYQTVVTPTQ